MKPYYNTMEHLEISDYGLTLTIPIFKKITFMNVYGTRIYNRGYGTFTTKDQKAILEHWITDAINELKIRHCQFVFEKHEQGHLHAHLYLKDTFEDEIDRFIFLFYEKVGIKDKRKYFKISDRRVLNNSTEWLDYMYKNPILPNHEMLDGHLKALDGIKIEYNDNIRLENNDLETDFLKNFTPADTYLTNAYLFKGKLKNKHIVEL